MSKCYVTKDETFSPPPEETDWTSAQSAIPDDHGYRMGDGGRRGGRGGRQPRGRSRRLARDHHDEEEEVSKQLENLNVGKVHVDESGRRVLVEEKRPDEMQSKWQNADVDEDTELLNTTVQLPSQKELASLKIQATDTGRRLLVQQQQQRPATSQPRAQPSPPTSTTRRHGGAQRGINIDDLQVAEEADWGTSSVIELTGGSPSSTRSSVSAPSERERPARPSQQEEEQEEEQQQEQQQEELEKRPRQPQQQYQPPNRKKLIDSDYDPVKEAEQLLRRNPLLRNSGPDTNNFNGTPPRRVGYVDRQHHYQERASRQYHHHDEAEQQQPRGGFHGGRGGRGRYQRQHQHQHQHVRYHDQQQQQPSKQVYPFDNNEDFWYTATNNNDNNNGGW